MVEIILPADVEVPLKEQFGYTRKVVYLDSSETEIDITGSVLPGLSCTSRRLKDGQLGSFNIPLANIDGEFLNKFQKGTKIRIYADHVSSNPTNKIFEGKVINFSTGLTADNKWIMELIGMDYPEIVGDKISASFSSAVANTALNGLIDDNPSWNLTHTGVSSLMTDSIETDSTDAAPVSIFAEILKQTGYD